MINKSKIAVIDIDGTLISGHVQQHLINYLLKEKRIDFLFVLKLNFLFLLYKLRIIRDVRHLFEFGIKYIDHKKVTEIDKLISNFVSYDLDKKVYKGSKQLISGLKNNGYEILLHSAAIDIVVSRLKDYFGADGFISTKTLVQGDEYISKLDGDINYGKVKVNNLNSYLETRGLNWSDVHVYTDHDSDLPLLKKAADGYIVNPSVRMSLIAKINNIKTLQI